MKMRQNSTSSASLKSLENCNGSSSRKGFIRRTDNDSLSFFTFGGKKKRSTMRATSSVFSGDKSSAPKLKKFAIPRNTKSLTSLISLEKESSSSFSHLATQSAISHLAEFDKSMEEIGHSPFISTRKSLKSATICESKEHDTGDLCPFYIAEDSDYPDDEALSSSTTTTTTTMTPKNNIRRVDRDNIHRVCRVGRGGYSDVYMVLDHEQQKCALKALSSSRLKSTEEFVTAAIDLAMEAKILSELDHPNIIQLKGISSSTFSDSYAEGTEEGFFLVVDLLNDVLNESLDRWRKAHRKSFGRENKWNFSGRLKVDAKMMYGRMESVALGIVRGMIYLHDKGIVLRDLKPANVGFDERGSVRLFDFGMARKLEDCDPDEICGSLRYMSPEVMAGNGYSFGADVYSFGVMLYEICSLNVAFDVIRNYADRKELNRLVIEESMRPKLKKIPCPLTTKLIEDCWQVDPTQRPSFQQIYERINDILSCKNKELPPKWDQ